MNDNKEEILEEFHEPDEVVIDEEMEREFAFQHSLSNKIILNNELILNKKISGNVFRLYCVLKMYALKDRNQKRIFPSRETLANNMGMSERQIDRLKKELREFGLIDWIRVPGKGKYWHNVYSFKYGPQICGYKTKMSAEDKNVSSLIGEDGYASGESVSVLTPTDDSPSYESRKEEDSSYRKFTRIEKSQERRKKKLYNNLEELKEAERLEMSEFFNKEKKEEEEKFLQLSKKVDMEKFEEWKNLKENFIRVRSSTQLNLLTFFIEEYPKYLYKGGDERTQNELEVYQGSLKHDSAPPKNNDFKEIVKIN